MCAPLVHTFWPLISQPPSTRVALRLDAGGVGAGIGLAEQLAPHDLVGERGADPPGDLVVGGVLDQREDDPAGDAVRRPLDARGVELLLDDQLLDRTGTAAPRLGPVRHDVAGVDQPVAQRGAFETLGLGDEGLQLLADRFRLGRKVDRTGAANAVAV